MWETLRPHAPKEVQDVAFGRPRFGASVAPPKSSIAARLALADGKLKAERRIASICQ
jgi:hypothetical protein